MTTPPDPDSRLPPELLTIIINTLDVNADRDTLLALLRVSQFTWEVAARLLYRNLCLSGRKISQLLNRGAENHHLFDSIGKTHGAEFSAIRQQLLKQHGVGRRTRLALSFTKSVDWYLSVEAVSLLLRAAIPHTPLFPNVVEVHLSPELQFNASGPLVPAVPSFIEVLLRPPPNKVLFDSVHINVWAPMDDGLLYFLAPMNEGLLYFLPARTYRGLLIHACCRDQVDKALRRWRPQWEAMAEVHWSLFHTRLYWEVLAEFGKDGCLSRAHRVVCWVQQPDPILIERGIIQTSPSVPTAVPRIQFYVGTRLDRMLLRLSSVRFTKSI
ncbi:hypothetical protein Q8F55_000572 [Vanrija albida]|uniref:F-box domain-containing protein n=1 Tax=Vanrija albida TaxID=181172 RepID=A0ABR3QDN7_9TREE